MKTDALWTLLAALGRETSGDDDVELSGQDPVLQTRFRIGEAAASALGAVGLAVSDLWQLRSGRRQAVRVDVAAAAASLLGFTSQRVLDPEVAGRGKSSDRDRG